MAQAMAFGLQNFKPSHKPTEGWWLGAMALSASSQAHTSLVPKLRTRIPGECIHIS